MASFQSHPPLRLDIVHRVATYFDFLSTFDENDKDLSIFTISEKPTLVTLKDYAWLLGMYLKVSLNSFVVAAVYATKLQSIITPETTHLILVAATVAAARTHDQTCPSYADLASVACLEADDLKQMEGDILTRLKQKQGLKVSQGQFHMAALALSSCAVTNDAFMAYNVIQSCLEDPPVEEEPSQFPLDKTVTPPPPPPAILSPNQTKPEPWAMMVDSSHQPQNRRYSWSENQTTQRRCVIFSPSVEKKKVSSSTALPRAVTFPFNSGEGQQALLNDALIVCAAAKKEHKVSKRHSFSWRLSRRLSWMEAVPEEDHF